MSPISTTTSTRSEEVHARLRSELLQGEHQPGSKLRITEIAGRYSVSPSVIREALTRLAGQGLVTAIPQRGFTVAELSVADLKDLSHARRLIEMSALREAIRDGDLAWESSVLAAHHRLARTPLTDHLGHVREDWSQAHADFHRALLSGGRSTTLIEIADNLRDRSDLYIHWSRELAHDDGRDAASEHQAIADLSVARDADRAAEALSRHIDRTTDALVCYAESKADSAVE